MHVRPNSGRGTMHFSPVAYVLAELAGRPLTLAARLLALVLAHKVRVMSDGQYRVWRGRASLSAITGLSTKTIGKARCELVDAGLFIEKYGIRSLKAAGGREYHVARGVIVLELVRDVTAFVAARDRSRDEQARDIEKETHVARLEVQKRFFRNEMSADERIRQEEVIREDARRAARRTSRPTQMT